MKTRHVLTLCVIVGLTVQVNAQRKTKTPAKPITTQTATTEDGRTVVLRSNGTWTYETTESTGNMFVLTGTCRLQLVKGFFPCHSKVIFMQKTNDLSHVTFVKNDDGKQFIFDLAGRADRQPNLENYYLQIDTFSIGGASPDVIRDDGMEGECHFRISKSGKIFYFVRCDIYNREKGTLYNFYLENITKTERNALN